MKIIDIKIKIVFAILGAGMWLINRYYDFPDWKRIRINKLKKRISMKKLITMLTIVALATTMSFAQNEDNVTGTEMVLDSTIIQDMKLLIAYDRLFAEQGLINTITKEASREKAETGEIKKAAATQKFIKNINKAYLTFADKFIKVDTVYVDSLKLVNQINNIQTWQNKVVNDPEIKDATSLSVWEQKAKRLEKLQRYYNQIK